MMQRQSTAKGVAAIVAVGVGVAWARALATGAAPVELRLPDEPRYVPVEHSRAVLDAPDDRVFDFWPETWRKLDLSGTWKARYYPLEKGADFEQDPGTQAGHSGKDVATADWENTAVPGSIPKEKHAQGPIGRSGLAWDRTFSGVIWYRHGFALPAEWAALQQANWRVLLRFEHFRRYADAWLNGRSVGPRMSGSAAPATVDITDLLQAGTHALAVRVGVPTGGTRQMGRDGLSQPVRLICVPPVYAEKLLVATPVAPPALRLRLHLVSHEPEQTGPLTLTLVPAGRTAAGPAQTLPLGTHTIPRGPSVLDLQVATPGVGLWTPETPNLYVLRIAAGDRDVAGDRIGFRTFAIQGPDFYLNGKRIKLMGVMGMGGVSTRRHIDSLRQANVNFIRPHNGWGLQQTFGYHLCDEVGLMVYDEYHYGPGFKADDPAGWARRKEEYTAWVHHVHNRASCVLWDFGGNEVFNHDPEVVPAFDKLYDLLGELDLQGRPRGSSSGRPTLWCFREMPVLEKMDFADTHEYPGNDYGSYRDLVPLTEAFAAAVRQRIGNVPIMNCEYGFGGGYLRYRPQTKQVADLYAVSPWGPAEKRQYIEFAESKIPEIGEILRHIGVGTDFKTFVTAPAEAQEIAARQSKLFLDMFRCLGSLMDGGSGAEGRNLLFYHPRGNPLVRASNHLGTPNPITYSGTNDVKTPTFYVYRRAYNPQYIGLLLPDRYATAGATWQADCHILNDSSVDWRSARAVCQLRDAGGTVRHQEQVWQGALPAQLHERVSVRIPLAAELATGKCQVELYLVAGDGQRLADNYHDLFVAGRDFLLSQIRPAAPVALYEPAAGTAAPGRPATTGAILRQLGIAHDVLEDFAPLGSYRFLVVGREALDDRAAENGDAISRWVEAGGRLLCFEQKAGKLPFLPGVEVEETKGLWFAQVPIAEHPVFQGLTPALFEDWNGDQGVLFRQGLWPLDEGLLSIAKIKGEWERDGQRPWRMTAAAYAVGSGEIVLSQFTVTDRYGRDPIATRFTQNLLAYVLTQPRSALSLPRGGTEPNAKP
ncbi:MAG: hypothetical protein JXR37_13975 [Kiritimatiellae bacterium]|nr:hypothetical protein [Kiritimatiellia bacterium]